MARCVSLRRTPELANPRWQRRARERSQPATWEALKTQSGQHQHPACPPQHQLPLTAATRMSVMSAMHTTAHASWEMASWLLACTLINWVRPPAVGRRWARTDTKPAKRAQELCRAAQSRHACLQCGGEAGVDPPNETHAPASSSPANHCGGSSTPSCAITRESAMRWAERAVGWYWRLEAYCAYDAH